MATFQNLVPAGGEDKPAPQPQNVGWELGVRQTVDADQRFVWDFMLGDGLDIWLGVKKLELAKGAPYTTNTGMRGQVRTFTMGDRIRMTWRAKGWDHDSVLQVTVREVREGTTIAFHQEQLKDRDERREMVAHWKKVIGRLEDEIMRVY